MTKRPDARRTTSGDYAQQLLDMARPKEEKKEEKPKSIRGLQDGDIRITCVLNAEQSQLLHDWARTTRSSFRDVLVAACTLYIDERIRVAVADGHKVYRPADESKVPATYAELYKDEESSDVYKKYLW